jgi:hypothetical protein
MLWWKSKAGWESRGARKRTWLGWSGETSLRRWFRTTGSKASGLHHLSQKEQQVQEPRGTEASPVSSEPQGTIRSQVGVLRWPHSLPRPAREAWVWPCPGSQGGCLVRPLSLHPWTGSQLGGRQHFNYSSQLSMVCSSTVKQALGNMWHLWVIYLLTISIFSATECCWPSFQREEQECGEGS